MWYLVQHVLWTTNPWHVLLAGFVVGAVCAAGSWVLTIASKERDRD